MLSFPPFVDCHSHTVPSGDDGAQTIEQGVELARDAARHGTQILFATPHIWPHLPLTAEREARVRAAFAEVQERAELDLRLGFELTPAEPLLGEDPTRYVLPGTRHVLVEVPFSGPVGLLIAVCEHIAAHGLTPVVAHPERTEAVLADNALAADLAARGWLLQVNATSLSGWDGPEIQRLAWELVDAGHVSLVASDGHRLTRPARLEDAYAAVRERVGERAVALFDGSALGLLSSRRGSSRAASPDA
jgi:protein-tyrosine phosphatase